MHEITISNWDFAYTHMHALCTHMNNGIYMDAQIQIQICPKHTYAQTHMHVHTLTHTCTHAHAHARVHPQQSYKVNITLLLFGLAASFLMNAPCLLIQA